MSFVHLHCHSEYSILECPNRVDALIEAAKKYDMPALAITDNAGMYGAIEFYQKAKRAGVNPILGADMYVCSDMSIKERWQHRLILLAKSFTGYQSLIKLISKAHLDGFYYKPRIDLATCAEFASDVIAISPGGRGPVANYLQMYQDEKAEETAQFLKNIYGDDFYLGIQRVGNAHESLVEEGSIALSEKLDIPIVATNDVYYMTPDDSNLRDILFCIQTGKTLDSEASAKFQNDELYFRSPMDMERLFSDHPDWVSRTLDVAAKCNIDIEMDQVLLPNFACPDNKSSEVYLEELVWQGIDELYDERSKEIEDRVAFELEIINKMKYPNYFLIIYDFLDFCTRSGIPVGPGRGSAAGSIVAYALKITALDPIKYNLLFERFLNPERVSMPDIDIDFCIKRRGEVIDYIVERWGQDCVSQIITFGTMQSRAVVRDVGRALDIPLADVDQIAKLIPSAPGVVTTIPEAMEQVKELKQLYDKRPDIKQLLDIGIKLEGITRHTSTHAAGVVISRDPLTTVVPLTQNDGQVATQYAMADIESIGLLKMDILGLRNLTVIESAVSIIQEKVPDFNIEAVSIEDPKTFGLLQEGRGVGVFQCESKGMRQLMKDLQPDCFEDIIALLALYRPGPLGSGMVSDFVSNKLGKTEVKYSLDALEPILNETYGMIVYQEQVMQIAAVIGGFSLAQADMLRRAMGKKKKSVMDEMRKSFLAGAKEKDFPLSKAEDIFDLCYKFAEYGFNKSHSTAYALVSYQTAYLKAHYPVEYMAALLSSVVSNSEKTAAYIQECKDIYIEVIPPHINQSKYPFTIVPHLPKEEPPAAKSEDTEEETRPKLPQAICYGLSAIKNVGDGAIDSIVSEAPFSDLADMCMKVDLKQVNKRVIESLIKVGAMDEFGERSLLLATFESIMDKAQVLIRERSNGQIALFSDKQAGGGFSKEALDTNEYHVFSEAEKLKMEKELLGLYVTGHPLDSLKDYLNTMKTPINSFTEEHNNKMITVTGILSDCRRIITRSKKEMLIGNLEDLTGSLSVLVFSDDSFEEKAKVFLDDHVITVTGRFRMKEDDLSINCQSITVLDKASSRKSLYIDIDGLNMEKLQEIKALNKQFKGTFPLYLKFSDKTIHVHQKHWVVDDDIYKNQLEGLIGKGRMWVV